MAPNAIGPTGLTTSSQAELISFYTAQLQQIYGADINLASDSPDGQLMNLIIQSVLDLQDLLVQINNMFDPDNAVGVILDQRVAINGIQRQAGTFTITNITLVNNQSVNLFGLDQTDQPVYTVSDNAGNLWLLQTTQLGVSSGTHVYAFQAATPGANLTVPNTITVPVTIVLGVVSVNNPTTYMTLGINEESDAILKLRRAKSVALSAQGYLAGLLAALLNIDGVTAAFVYENTSSSTDGSGVPGHSIWVIVAGSGAAADIAEAIYTKRNAGCGMFGDTRFNVTQIDGTVFTVQWDSVVAQNLFIAFTVTSINGTTAPNIAAIRAQLPVNYMPGVFQEANVNAISTQVQAIDPNTLVTAAGVSIGQTQILTLSGIAASGTFKLNYNGNASSTLNWNDSVGTIQSAVQALSGLSTATVTGSIASQTLTIDLSTISDVLGLITVSNNTLQTSAPASITFSYNEGYVNLLSPSRKNDQFAISSENIIILPMILSPPTSTVAASGTETFTGLGGYGTYTYSISVNNSGGSINSSTGVYTAGSTPSTDTLKVIDQLGNTALATVTVT